MRLNRSDSKHEYKHLKIVRADTCADVPGEIVEVDTDSRTCTVRVLAPKADGSGLEERLDTFTFGCGIRIVRRAR